MTSANFILLVIGVSLSWLDIKYRNLPNLIVLPAIALGIYLTGNWQFALLMFCIGALFYSKNYIAGGDVKLLAMFGAFIGFYSFIAVALSIILVMGYRKFFNNVKVLPYAPFLFISSLLFILK